MRAVVQRTGPAKCEVNGQITGSIPCGLVVFVSIDSKDSLADVEWLSNKIAGLRIFPDSDGKMNRSILDIQEDWKTNDNSDPSKRPGILSISQFTLHGRIRKGFRPSFTDAADPEMGQHFYKLFNDHLRSRGLLVQEGIFGAYMNISLINEGPVTILIDTKSKD